MNRIEIQSGSVSCFYGGRNKISLVLYYIQTTQTDLDNADRQIDESK